MLPSFLANLILHEVAKRVHGEEGLENELHWETQPLNGVKFSLLLLVIISLRIAWDMGADFFFQPSITIRKGEPLTLVDDSTAPHLITNGSWVSGSERL